MYIIERLAEIEAKLAEIIQQISIIELDGETLRLVLFLKDGTNLGVTEQWEGEKLQ